MLEKLFSLGAMTGFKRQQDSRPITLSIPTERYCEFLQFVAPFFDKTTKPEECCAPKAVDLDCPQDTASNCETINTETATAPLSAAVKRRLRTETFYNKGRKPNDKLTPEELRVRAISHVESIETESTTGLRKESNPPRRKATDMEEEEFIAQVNSDAQAADNMPVYLKCVLDNSYFSGQHSLAENLTSNHNSVPQELTRVIGAQTHIVPHTDLIRNYYLKFDKEKRQHALNQARAGTIPFKQFIQLIREYEFNEHDAVKLADLILTYVPEIMVEQDEMDNKWIDDGHRYQKVYRKECDIFVRTVMATVLTYT